MATTQTTRAEAAEAGKAEREAAEARRLAAIPIDRDPSGGELLARVIRLERIVESLGKKSLAELHAAAVEKGEVDGNRS